MTGRVVFLPWAALAVAVIIALLTAGTGVETGDRLMVIALVAALVAAIQGNATRSAGPPSE